MPRSPAPAGQWQRADASMSLLVDMLTGAVDQAYAEARGRDRPGAHGARRRVLVAALLVPVGVCAGTAVAQVRGRSSSTSDARRMLVATSSARPPDPTRSAGRRPPCVCR